MKDLIRKVLKEDLKYWGVDGKKMGPKLEEESKKYHRKHLEHLRNAVDLCTTAFISNLVTAL